jgi:hypothetical protein
MLLLHGALPHSHHLHENLAASVAEISEHDDQSNHGHRHDDQEDDNNLGLLGFLLGNHAHTSHHSDFSSRSLVKRQIKVESISTYILPENVVLHTEGKPSNKKMVVYYPPDNYNTFLIAYSLRGPPSLG